VRPRVRCGCDWWGGVLLAAGQRKVAPLGLAESGVFSLGVDLPQDRCVERRVWCCPLGRRPETRDLHRLDHRFAIHRVLRFAKYDDRGFDLADLFGLHFCRLGRFRFLCVAFGHGRGLGCHRLFSRCSYGLAAIIRPGELTPDDPPRRVSALTRDLPSAFGAVAQLLAFDDVEHRIVVYVAVVIGVVFVGRIVDLFARAHAGDRIFEGLILLRHQTYLGVATDEFAVFFQAFDELVDGHVRGLRFGWGFEKSSLRRHTWSQGIPNTSSALWPQLAGISMISCLWPGLANNGG